MWNTFTVSLVGKMVSTVHERCSDKSCRTAMNTTVECSKSKAPRPIGEAVHQVVEQARAENRLVSGILDVCDHLQSCRLRSSVLCLISEMSAHTGLYKLVEAFCREYRIRLLMVKDINAKDNICSSDEIGEHFKTQRDKTRSSHADVPEVSSKNPKPCMPETSKSIQNRDVDQTIHKSQPESVQTKTKWRTQQPEVTCLLVKTGERLTPEEDFLISYHDTYRSFVSDRFPCVEVSLV